MSEGNPRGSTPWQTVAPGAASDRVGRPQGELALRLRSKTVAGHAYGHRHYRADVPLLHQVRPLQSGPATYERSLTPPPPWSLPVSAILNDQLNPDPMVCTPMTTSDDCLAIKSTIEPTKSACLWSDDEQTCTFDEEVTGSIFALVVLSVLSTMLAGQLAAFS
jgi:hypothetical protein